MFEFLLAACVPSVEPPTRLEWETAQVQDGLAGAIESGDNGAAVQLCAHALQLKLTSPVICRRLADGGEDPGVRAQAHALLYEVTTGDDRALHHDLALENQVRARYTPERREATLATHVGVTREMGLAAIATLRAEYVVQLDDRVLLEAARRRLLRVSTLLGAPYDPRGTLVEMLDQSKDLPEETLVAELTEAVFAAADAHSSPIWPAQVAQWNQHHSGERPGRVGVQLGPQAEVLGFHPAGSAFLSGLHQGDLLTHVGDVELGPPEGRQDAAIAALGGPDGTTVVVKAERAGRPVTFTLTRQTLRDPTVFANRRTPDGNDIQVERGIGLVRIGGFRPHTADELEAVAPMLIGLKTLILDLRANAGGDLDAALTVLDMFMKNGPMLDVVGRVLPTFEDDWGMAKPGGSLEKLELIVLVDQDTASSAEIVAGALQQAGARVVGVRTTGKGSSQVLRQDARGFALQFTNLHWTLPDGTVLQRTPGRNTWGVQPNLQVSVTPAERTMLGILQAQRERLKVHPDGTPLHYLGMQMDPTAPALTADPQIQAAIELARP